MFQTSDSSNTNQAGRSVGSARLGPNHGYSIDGDVALLHAEVEVPNDRSSQGARWALQLWACEAPHAGGALSGVKVAEATLPVVTAQGARPMRLDTEALARVPGGLRDYSMVLVLASDKNGSFSQVHDFANYPERQRFITPHLEGSVGYGIEGKEAVLRADRIYNPRPGGSLSGSLRLELWALDSEYRGGPFAGYELASHDLGRLAGERCFDSLEQRVAFQPPAYGEWQVVLMLREWAGDAGYVTRDYCNFAARYVVAEPTPVAATEAPQPKAAAKATTEEPAAGTALAAANAEVAPKPAATPATPASAAAQDARVSIMRAGVEELTVVKGLNRKLAAEIIKHRPYKSLDDLLKIRGIGPKMLASLRAVLSL